MYAKYLLHGPVSNFRHAIRLWVWSGAEGERRVEQLHQFFPEVSGEARITITNDRVGESVVADDFSQEAIGDVACICFS